MPGKACERFIFHVMAYAYFFGMPKIRTLHSYSKIGHFKIIEHMKIGHFKKRARDENSNKKTERIWKCSNFGHFKKICICHHVKNISFTCFSGHFIIPPVVVLSYYDWQNNFYSVDLYQAGVQPSIMS